MPVVEYRVTQSATDVFRRLRNQMANPEPAFKAMISAYAAHQRQWFATEGTAGGAPGWKRLSPKYARWKRKRGFGTRRIMHGPDFNGHRGGALRKELAPKGQSFPRQKITKDGFRVWTEIPYAELHHRGSGRLPARRLLRTVDANLMSRFEAELLAHLELERASRFSRRGGNALNKGGKRRTSKRSR